MKQKIIKGDNVEVIGGAAKGTRGEVIKVIPKKSQVVVQGVNVRKKHQRQMQQQGRNINPGIIEAEGPIHVSNVMLICPSCKERTRVAIRRDQGELVRVCKICDEEIG